MPPTDAPSLHTNTGRIAAGGVELFWMSVRPVTPLRGRVVLLHGYGDHVARYREAMEFFASHGLMACGFDFRGQGQSTGRRAAVERWEDYLDDLDAFLRTAETACDGPTFVLAHSHGALVAAAAAEQDRLPARGVILCSAYFRPAHRVPWWKRLTAPILSRLLPHVRFATGLPYDAMTTDPEMSAEAREDPHLERTATPRWFVAMRIAQMQVLHSAGRFRLPVLALHGTDDSVADHQAVRTFIDACGAPDREFRLIPTGRHELLRERFRQDIYRQCMEWIEARLVKSI